MPLDAEPPWWTSAVVYQPWPRSFADSDGDGIGDLGKIVARLDHLAALSAPFALMVRAAPQRAGESPGPAIAAVPTAGYGRVVTGPPLVGFLAEATSVRLALGAALGAVLGLLCLTAAMLASSAR